MALESGTRLGPYAILSPIGAGGMGEVYKATDTRLDRTVAVKVLPELFADSPERKARFEREAKAISQLNHPHICTLHDVGEQDGIDYLVMEYIEGETLAERLRKGALPLEKALEYGVQIADGLDTAHRVGIVHRDLKPANIIIGKSGVKLVDYGLAKLVEEPAVSEGPDAPTRQRDLTRERVVVGTPQYMAPEQVVGESVDARTDIFAFGAVLYEMVTGTKAFRATSPEGLAAAILAANPPPPTSSPLLDRVIRTCLMKEPEERWENAGEARRLLRWVADSGSHDAVEAVSKPEREVDAPTVLVASALAALLAGVAVWALQPSPPPMPTVRFRVVLPASQRVGQTITNSVLALSPDARDLAYVASGQIYVRQIDALDGMPIAGVRGNLNSPFFSPDGQWIAYFERAALKKISIGGGAPVTLYEGGERYFRSGAAWAPDGTIIFFEDGRGILRVRDSGGEPEVLVPMDENSYASAPQILPGGAAVLYTLSSGGLFWGDAQIVAQRLGTQDRIVLVDGGTYASYLEPGFLIYARGTTLMAAAFDTDALRLTGSPVPIAQGVSHPEGGSAARYSVSSDGSLAYVSSAFRRLVWVDRAGRTTAVTESVEMYQEQQRLSPDGKRLAVEIETPEGDGDIWILDLERGTRVRLTDEGRNTRPVWSPDGTRIAFFSDRSDNGNLYWRPSDGSGETTLLLSRERGQFPESWSPDGRAISFLEAPATGSTRDVWILPLEGEPFAFTDTASYERQAAFSPDGHWLAYTSDESGQDEVYLQAYPGPGPRMSASVDGGHEPVWSLAGMSSSIEAAPG